MPDAVRTIVALHKVHRTLESASLAACDLALPAYACLLEAHERGDRITRARILEDVAPAASQHELDLLESKELITYRRSSSDRRALSAVTTPKGERAVSIADEALSVSLISLSGKIDESTFNRMEELIYRTFPSSPSDETPGTAATDAATAALLPAPLIATLCRIHEQAVRESNRIALSSGQVAALVLLAPARHLSLSALSSMLAVRQDILMLQLESLASRSLVQTGDARGPYSLTDTGRQRAKALIDAFTASFGPVANPGAEENEAAAELIDFAEYLFLSSEPPRSTATVQPEGTVRFAANDGLADLLAMLSSLFSYPDAAEALARTATEFPETAKRAFANAGFHVSAPQNLLDSFAEAATMPDDLKVSALRAEYTRLFYASPHAVSLRGADYVRRHRTDFSIAHGERAAVGLEYRKLGLKNKPGVGTPFDDLVSELDFTLYLTRSESDAIKRGDAMNASEWRALRDDFVRRHLRELALGAADEVSYHSDNAFLLFYAQMLSEAIARM